MFWRQIAMATNIKKPARTKGGAKTADEDRTRLRRFLFLWVPIICIVLIAFYASALDPSKPTGRTMGANLIGKDASATYRIKLDNGEETAVFIPEKLAPPPGSRLVMEEYTTALLKKKTYRYLRTEGAAAPSK